MFDLTAFDKWLLATEKGWEVKSDVPEGVRKELMQINEEYVALYGKNLLQIGK